MSISLTEQKPILMIFTSFIINTMLAYSLQTLYYQHKLSSFQYRCDFYNIK